MSIKITIPNTSSDTLTFGSANTPTAAQIAGIDSGSSNGQLAIYTTASGTSTERVRVDSSGNVGIGTSSPSAKFVVAGGGAAIQGNGYPSAGSGWELYTDNSTGTGSNGSWLQSYSRTSSAWMQANYNALAHIFSTSGAERMRIDSSGNLLVGVQSQFNSCKQALVFDGSTNIGLAIKNSNVTVGQVFIGFYNSAGTNIGTITQNATTTVAYNTSSDYRLKENIVPMTGALSKVALLKPVTYTWKQEFGGESGQGFIAHELQDVVPDCVTGEKDAVDANGNPVYQGIDTSFLVATLTAAIQELKALVDTQASTITALTARIEALEKK